eukprot:1182333-Amorphochlora_amoeboformis.AAC.1
MKPRLASGYSDCHPVHAQRRGYTFSRRRNETEKLFFLKRRLGRMSPLVRTIGYSGSIRDPGLNAETRSPNNNS